MSDDRQRERSLAGGMASGARAPSVRTLLICDLADSTALVERMGDGLASELLRRHDRVARDLMHGGGGREIDKTDGFLVLFERPIAAVAFALAYHRALRALGDEAKQTLRARVGIHVGEVVLWENAAADIADGAKPIDVEGLAKPVAARLMSLALPGQTLLSGVAFSLAQRAESELERAADVRWLTHGRYRFKGVPAPMLVHEAGETGFSPLQAPPSTSKAQRDVPLWRKPGILALEVIAVSAIVGIGFALSLRAPPAIAFGERDWIVMGELRNLTGETLLDESLETAFRISLEQSRYVNVLPDLKLRDALERMQRNADTPVDREIASEIALREGARAVILPTVAEIGGRVRVSAEVIDPNTQTTVYAESADGLGAASALDSIDTVTHELRAKLGEALKSIENDSEPLPKVTSASLPALRHYALGQQAYIESRLGQARENFEMALKLDSRFALASIGMARVAHTAGDKIQAKRHALTAVSQSDRLTHRDAMYVDAFAKIFGPPQKAVDAWKILSEMYPDFHVASYNAANWTLEYTGDFRGGLESVGPATSPESPIRAEGFYLQGTLQLCLDQLEDAQRSFDQAKALGEVGVNHMLAALHMARREYPQAEAILIKSVNYGLNDNDPQKDAAMAALLTDRGQLNEAAALVEKALANVHGQRGIEVVYAAWRSAISSYTNQDKLVEHATAATNVAVPLLGEAEGVTSADAATQVLVMAYLMALNDKGDVADVLAARVDGFAETYPTASALRRLLDAEQRLRQGNFEDAIETLERQKPPQLYLEHLTRLRIHRAAGNFDDALREADWLSMHRGLALGEFLGRYSLNAIAIVESNIAGLTRAELLHAATRNDEARTARNAFLQRWPNASSAPMFRERIERLDAALGVR